MKQITRLSLISASVLFVFHLGSVAYAEIFPAEGPPGTTVTISGEGFGDFKNTQDNRVEFQGASALIQSWEPDFILVKVPLKATSGPVMVMNGESKREAGVFTLQAVKITEVTPSEVEAGSLVTITGENFGNTMRVEDGLLKIRYDGYGPELNGRFGTVYFNRELKDYRLKVEYRFVGETAPGAPEWGYRDSGIQFHGQPPKTQKLDQAFPVCLEYNFHGGNGTDDRPLGAACTNGMFIEYNGEKNTTTCIPAAVPKTFHGNQWVTAEIDIRDGKITHYVNGEEILSYANPTYNSEKEAAKMLMVNGDSKVKGGYVSLQSNSHPIDFRKIELLEY